MPGDNQLTQNLESLKNFWITVTNSEPFLAISQKKKKKGGGGGGGGGKEKPKGR